MKALALICLLTACRAPDRWHAGVTQYNMDGTRTTSAGPLGAGRTTAEADGDGVALTVGVEGGIGTSKTEEALERIAEAQERANLMREDEVLKAKEQSALEEQSPRLAHNEETVGANPTRATTHEETAPAPVKEPEPVANGEGPKLTTPPAAPPIDWSLWLKTAGPGIVVLVITALTGKKVA